MDKSLREESKRVWTAPDNGTKLEHINAGSLQRIADAVEKMALRHTELMRDRDSFERSYKRESERCGTLERSNASLRGQITKLKKKAESVPSECGDSGRAE